MFKYLEDQDLIVYGEHQKIIMRQCIDGSWNIYCMERSIPIDIACKIFRYWFKHQMYLINCPGEQLVSELKRVVNGGVLFAGDRFIDKNDVSHLFDDCDNTDRPTINLSMGGLQHIVALKKYIIPRCSESIDNLKVRYDPTTQSMRVYVKGNYEGRIPLLY